MKGRLREKRKYIERKGIKYLERTYTKKESID